jgi:hypothetical protein
MAQGLEETWELHRGLARRDYSHPDQAKSFESLLRRLLLRRDRPLRDQIDGKPPRPIASAMACALFAQPHLSALGGFGRECASRVLAVPSIPEPDPPLITDQEAMSVALGIRQWELDELREEIDRRAGEWVRQVRLADWLWQTFERHDHPETFFLSLLPCRKADIKKAQVILRRGRLYLAVERPAMDSPLGMFLGWEEHPPSRSHVAGFDSLCVSEDLLLSIRKVHGMSPSEARAMLDAVVVVIPIDQAARYLNADRWRTGGFATLTQLGSGRSRKAMRPKPLAADQTGWDQWLVADGEGVSIQGRPEDLFDELATERVQAMCSPLYAALLSTHEAPGFERENTHFERLGPLHVERHLTQALSPLLAWASSNDTRNHIANTLGMDRTLHLDPVMDTLNIRWTHHYQEKWVGLIGAQHATVEGHLLEHLLQLKASLNGLLMIPPDARSPHLDAARLFVAYYLNGSPVQRLWTPSLSAPGVASGRGEQEDVLSDWFLGLWTRILDVCVVVNQQSA